MAGGAGGGGAGVQVGRLGGGEGSVGGGGRTVGAFVVGDHTGSGGCATPEIAVTALHFKCHFYCNFDNFQYYQEVIGCCAKLKCKSLRMLYNVPYLAICRNLCNSYSYLSGFGGFVVRTLAIGKVVVLFRL